MSLELHVDGDRWRDHLRAVADATPGLVPVAKGNGYGFGLRRLARRAGRLGADTLAVGTYPELADVASRYAGDLVVLSPWRPGVAVPAGVDPHRVIHTVGRLDDLTTLLAADDRPRVVLEQLTSMKRHGFTPRGLRAAAELVTSSSGRRESGVRLEGLSIHLPLEDGGNLAEAGRLLTDAVAAGLADGPTTLWVSHLDTGPRGAVRRLADQHPALTVRPRIGTALWLGDRDALTVTARVLDLHPVDRGERFGYRGRILPRTGTIVVVSGGTAHGIGLEAPTGDGGLRARAGSLARGGLDAVGLAKSPFTVTGKARYFAEPPHMQSSMLFLPAGADVPEVGDEVSVRVRFTATTFDAVHIH